VLDINPQQLAKQRAGVLGVALRVATPAAITRADIQVAVRAEDQLPPLWLSGWDVRMR
jgi:hypothetical protein